MKLTTAILAITMMMPIAAFAGGTECDGARPYTGWAGTTNVVYDHTDEGYFFEYHRDGNPGTGIYYTRWDADCNLIGTMFLEDGPKHEAAPVTPPTL